MEWINVGLEIRSVLDDKPDGLFGGESSLRL